MILRPLVIALAALAALIAAPAGAQVPDLPDVLLTPERVETVLAAYPAMRERLQTMSTELEATGDANDVASRLQALAMVGGVQGELNGAAVELGFTDFMDWLSTTNAVFMAHAFAQSPEVDAQMQAALDQIDSQTSLTAAQKEQMKAAIMQSMGALQQMKPPEQNVAAVAPYRDEIEALLED